MQWSTKDAERRRANNVVKVESWSRLLVWTIDRLLSDLFDCLFNYLTACLINQILIITSPNVEHCSEHRHEHTHEHTLIDWWNDRTFFPIIWRLSSYHYFGAFFITRSLTGLHQRWQQYRKWRLPWRLLMHYWIVLTLMKWQAQRHQR